MAARQESDYWMPGNATFVHYGEGFMVSPNLTTYSIGEVATYESRRKGTDSQQDKVDVVTQINTSTLSLPTEKAKPIMLQKGRGRPVKSGKVSRMTEWRRKKAAEQGKLPI